MIKRRSMILGVISLVFTPMLAKASSLMQFRKAPEDQTHEIAEYFRKVNRAQTEKMLQDWAKDKPHFERVRRAMGYLLIPDPETGKARVELKDGKVDLDKAYELACWSDASIRAGSIKS